MNVFERARFQVPIYQLAPRVSMHPTDVGAVVNGRRPLRPDLAERIMAALDAIVQELGAR